MKLVALFAATSLCMASVGRADTDAACGASDEIFKMVADRYEPMKSGGGALMLTLARINMVTTQARMAAEGAGWDPAIVGTMIKLQESGATDGKGGFKPTPQDSPDYVLGLAKTLLGQLAMPCAGYDFAVLP